MFPCRCGRRNSLNRFCVVVPVFPVVPPWFLLVLLVSGGWGLGLLVQILDGGRGWFVGWFVVGLWVFLGGWVTSPRPISTGRLGIAAVHLRPIDPVVCGWPYPIVWVGNLILKCASRLDAFSGYHVRT